MGGSPSMAPTCMLIGILRLIYDMLRPVERALWKTCAAHDSDLDGAFTLDEACRAARDLVAMAEDDEDTSITDGCHKEELTRLRSIILREAIEGLFTTPNLCRGP